MVNPENTFFSVKRFIGRKMNEVTDECKQVPYVVIEDAAVPGEYLSQSFFKFPSGLVTRRVTTGTGYDGTPTPITIEQGDNKRVRLARKLGPVEVTFDAMMHDLVGGTGYLTGILGVAMAALAIRSDGAGWLRPLGLVCSGVAVAGFGAIIVDVELGGLFQRALEGSLAVFLLAFGWALARGSLSASRA